MCCAGFILYVSNWGQPNAYEKKYMAAALALAHLSALDGEVPVGAVVVKGGRVIGEGATDVKRKRMHCARGK
jgi:tRNA(Arg) A34 adenosine deaminase TadA